MTEPEQIQPKPRTIQFGRCVATIVTTEDGKKHLELDCQSKEARDEVAAILEEEAILRVNPKVILDDTPVVEPKPDTRLNPTES
ncbi:hypothetical protein ES703_122594 [subsurface metagenome]